MDFNEKPTLAHITSLRTHLMEVWRPTWGDWEERDSYYFQTFKLWPANITGRPTYHPARPRQIVDAAVDHQMGATPKVHRQPAGQGADHKEKATHVDLYLTAAFAESALLENVLTAKAVAKNLIHLGYGVLEGPLLHWRSRPLETKRGRSETDEDYEARMVLWQNEKKTWMPFRIRSPHPARVLLDPTEKNPSFAIKHAVRYAHELRDSTIRRENYKKKGSKREVDVWEEGDNPWALVMCDEYWTKSWHALVAHTDVSGASGNQSRGGNTARALIVERNTYGFVPYAHAFSGWGQMPTDESQNDPRYMAVGILGPSMEMLKLQAQAVSGRHNALIDATFPPRGTRQDPAELAANLARSDIIPMSDRGDAWILDTPNLPPWIAEAERWYDKDIELATMSRSLAGQHQTGVNTLGEAVILGEAAGRKFDGVNYQMEHLWTVMGSNMLRLVDVLDEPLYCRGHIIKPSDIEHDYSVQVSFSVSDLPLQLQLRELGGREVQEGRRSLETFLREDAQREDPEGERDLIMEDYVNAHPAVKEELAMLAARRIGLEGIIEKWNAMLQMGQTASTGGTVENGGNPPKPSGLLGPDGQPVLGGSLGQPPVNGPHSIFGG